MFEKFSQVALSAIQSARELAIELGASTVDPSHLFLVLIDLHSGALVKLHVDRERIRRAVLNDGKRTAKPTIDPPLSDAVQDILFAVVRERPDGTIVTLDLLLQIAMSPFLCDIEVDDMGRRLRDLVPTIRELRVGQDLTEGVVSVSPEVKGALARRGSRRHSITARRKGAKTSPY